MAKKEKAALVKREEMQPVSPFEEMERYFNDFFRSPWALFPRSMKPSVLPGMGEMSPSVDIFEEGNEVVVKAEIPGMKKEDINVTITENSLTIAGEKKHEERVEKKDYHRIERSYGSFNRCFRLPENVDGTKAKASFKDGLLEVRMPMTKEKKRKKISIS